MKFASYRYNQNDKPRFGFKRDKYIVDVVKCANWLNEKKGDAIFLDIPSSLKECLKNWSINFELLKKLDGLVTNEDIIETSKVDKPIANLELDLELLAPVPNPQSFRDFYAFEQHVRSARKLRGLDMHPDWFKIPIFYFSNSVALFGHREKINYPSGTDELDFELEFAVILADGGTNISSESATDYIAGYTICNDWSARDLQREEMAMNLGPAKGKDFATSFGPYMVTQDELETAWG